MFSGFHIALVTPFTSGGTDVDQSALKALVDWHLHNGTEGLVVCGSTGEGFSLTPEEHATVVNTVAKATRKRIPVIAGTGAMTTRDALVLAKQSEKAGADGLLIVAPPYLKPTQEGVFKHFSTLESAVSLPIILYNHPGRTGTLVCDETILRLSKLPGIIGVKDSTDDLLCPLTLRALLKETNDKKAFTLFSGDDGTVLAFLAQGGQGSISTIGNLVPALWKRLASLWRQGAQEKAIELQIHLYPLFKLVFSETSPACLKVGLAAMGLCNVDVRSPLQPFSEKGRQALHGLLKTLKRLEESEEDFAAC